MMDDRKVEQEALDWFTRLQDIEATEADWRAFTDWVAASPNHGAAYDALERLWVDLDAVEVAVEPSFITPMANPANDDARPRRRRGWLYPAAGAVAAVALAVALWPHLTDQGDLYRTTDQPLTVRLADGSNVQLNRHSEMRVRLARASRHIVLADGEAAFDVAHDAARPFVVEAAGREVRVLGTAFDIVSHDDAFSVEVERGVVAVTARSSTAPVRLTAGGRVRQVGDAAAQVDAVDPGAIAAWRSGVLVYRAATMAEVGRDLSRYFGKPVIVSASARDLRFTGALRIADEKTMLAQLRDFAPVTIQAGPAEVRLTSPGEG